MKRMLMFLMVGLFALMSIAMPAALQPDPGPDVTLNSVIFEGFAPGDIWNYFAPAPAEMPGVSISGPTWESGDALDITLAVTAGLYRRTQDWSRVPECRSRADI